MSIFFVTQSFPLALSCQINSIDKNIVTKKLDKESFIQIESVLGLIKPGDRLFGLKINKIKSNYDTENRKGEIKYFVNENSYLKINLNHTTLTCYFYVQS